MIVKPGNGNKFGGQCGLCNYNCNCKISYRSGKNDADADGLSRKQENTTTIFPEVLRAINITMMVEIVPLADTTIHPDGEVETDEEVPSEQLEGTALSAQDWRKAQASDANISCIMDYILTGQTPTTTQAEEKDIEHKYPGNWNKFKLNMLSSIEPRISEENVEHLALPAIHERNNFPRVSR